MTWNYDFTDAPRGKTKTVSAGKSGTKEIHVPEPVIIAANDGQTVTVSRWLPDEGRWNMLSKKEQPLAWMEYPKHPSASA